jgi:hypothetical protein
MMDINTITSSPQRCQLFQKNPAKSHHEEGEFEVSPGQLIRFLLQGGLRLLGRMAKTPME